MLARYTDQGRWRGLLPSLLAILVDTDKETRGREEVMRGEGRRCWEGGGGQEEEEEVEVWEIRLQSSNVGLHQGSDFLLDELYQCS